MSGTADWLVESVFPEGVPVRQWVLSMPWKLRYLMAKDARLKRRALKIFLDGVFRLLRKLSGAGSKARGGSVTAVQRFGSALNLNVHFHSLALDGVYEGGRFRRARAATEERLRELVERVGATIVKLARKSGYDVDLEKGMGGEEEEPTVFDGIQAASIKGMLAFPDRRGHYRRVKMLGKKEFEPERTKAGCARWGGFSVHANVRIAGNDRRGLAQLCRYVLRPPFSTERLQVDVFGQVVYRLRKPRADGSTHLVMEPVEFMEKLAALVPPPKAHLVHYHGVLGPNSGWRRQGKARGAPKGPAAGGGTGGKRRRRPWAELLQKTFGVEVLKCARCGGRMKLIAMIRKASVARKILDSMGFEVAAMEAESRWREAAGLDPPGDEARDGELAAG